MISGEYSAAPDWGTDMHGKTVGQDLGRVDTPIKMNKSQILPMMPLSLLLIHNTMKPLIISLLYLSATHPL